MLLVANKRGDPSKALAYLHVPKCGGTYAKKVLKQQIESNTEDCAFLETGMHQSLDSICGYRTGDKMVLEGTYTNSGKIVTDFSTNINCTLRNPFDWYDSYYYYKKNYLERKGVWYKEPLTPLNARIGDYEKAISNSLDDDYIKKCSHVVLQQEFCPSVWMKELDIGFYTAWFLYTVSDHKSVFDNLEKIKGDKLLECDVSIIRNVFNNIMFFDIEHLDRALKSIVSGFIGKEVVFESSERERVTKYEDNFLKCSDILFQNDELREKFMWKERFMFNNFYNDNFYKTWEI